MPNAQTDINDLVQGFARHIKQIKSPEYKESQVRLHYIDPFWELLGWDVQNREQRAPQDVEVFVEPSMDTMDDDGLRLREPDYLFRVNGFARFIVEAKKPSVDIDTDRKAIYQAKRYAWNAVIPFAVLTDFEQFRLFDTALKPVLNEPLRGLITDFKLEYHQYPAQWDVLVATFGRDAVADGSLERLRAQIRKVRPGRRLRTVDRMLIDLKGDEPVDREFLSYLDVHRKHFARHIYRDNRKLFPEADTLHGAAKLTEAVQRLMDRLVFIRVCEDRGIAQWGGVRETLDRIGSEGGDLYAALCAGFRNLDRSYNGYLFKPHFSEELTVDGGVLSDFIRELYPPVGSWDFSLIADDILGIVYERFLGNVVTVRKHQAEVEEKPEVRHAGGVYYTPRFVVDTIIRRVVGPQIKGKTPTDLLNVKILDPACGSGSFLVAAFQYLIDHCVRAVSADPALATIPATPKARKKRKDIAFKDGKGHWHVAPDFKAALLTNCLHGVDFDQQAVEVTVMSLYLKMLEGRLPPDWQREWLENELLPPLDNNIRCGNSLIDSPDFARWIEDKHGGLFPMDDDLRFRINPFDWSSRTRGFGRILDAEAVGQRGRAGFDCIIGNPPYIRVQELNKWAPEECEFYKWRYKSAAKGNYDIYVVFTEKALSLLAPDGLLGFIMPHKFLNKDYANGLRKVLVGRKSVHSLIHFNAHQVFRGVTTYTAILILQGRPNVSTVEFVSIEKLDDGTETMQKLAAANGSVGGWFNISSHQHPSREGPWSFTTSALLSASGDLPTLEDLTDIFVGVQTDADDVYYVRAELPLKNDGRVAILCPLTEKMYQIERKILRPLATGTTAKRYLLEPAQFCVVFPFLPDKHGRWQVIDAAVLHVEYPLAYRFFHDPAIAKRLKARAKGKLANSPTFWDFVYRKNLRRQHLAKVCVPRLAERVTAALDAGGAHIAYCLDNVDVCGVVPKNAKIPLEFLTGLLNSRVLDHMMRSSVRDSFRGGYLSLNKQYLGRLPIKLPETKDEKKLADRIVESVREIMDAKVKLRDGKLSDRERGQLETTVGAHERRIDEAVFALYGVKGLPSD